MKKTQIFLKKPVYFGLSIVELSKTVTYKIWYIYVKPTYGEKAKLCYMDTELCHMDTDNFIVYIKTDNIYKDIVEDVKTRFGTSNYELDTLLPKEKNKKVIGVMKD